MAHQGKPTPADDQRRIAKLIREGHAKTEVARIADVSRPTVYKYADARNAEQAALGKKKL